MRSAANWSSRGNGDIFESPVRELYGHAFNGLFNGDAYSGGTDGSGSSACGGGDSLSDFSRSGSSALGTLTEPSSPIFGGWCGGCTLFSGYCSASTDTIHIHFFATTAHSAAIDVGKTHTIAVLLVQFEPARRLVVHQCGGIVVACEFVHAALAQTVVSTANSTLVVYFRGGAFTVAAYTTVVANGFCSARQRC